MFIWFFGVIFLLGFPYQFGKAAGVVQSLRDLMEFTPPKAHLRMLREFTICFGLTMMDRIDTRFVCCEEWGCRRKKDEMKDDEGLRDALSTLDAKALESEPSVGLERQDEIFIGGCDRWVGDEDASDWEAVEALDLIVKEELGRTSP